MHFAARPIVSTALVVAVLGTASVALASLAAIAAASGTGAAASATPFVVEQVGTAAGLYPTARSPVPFTVRNANPYPLTLSAAQASNFTVDPAHAACNVTSLTATKLALSDALAAGATSSPKRLVVTMDDTAVDACQGATFTFDIVVTGTSG